MKIVSALFVLAVPAALLVGAIRPQNAGAPAVAGGVAAPLSIRCPPDLFLECYTSKPDPAENLKEFLQQGGEVTTDCRRTIINHVSDVAEGLCPIVITRTYEATTPNCGTARCEQLIFISDTEPPRFTSLVGGSVECGVPTKIQLTANDNCDRLEFFGELTGGTATGGATLVDLGLGSFELTMTSTGYVTFSFIVSDGCNKTVQTGRFSTNCDPAATAEGCSHGFWKNHTELWDEDGDSISGLAGFTASTDFNLFFGLTAAESGLPDGATMLDGLEEHGGTPDGSQLARDGVAALLNVSAGLEYDLPDGIADSAALESAITGAYQSHDFSLLSEQLGTANEQKSSFCD